jgi:hypothetical protein
MDNGNVNMFATLCSIPSVANVAMGSQRAAIFPPGVLRENAKKKRLECQNRNPRIKRQSWKNVCAANLAMRHKKMSKSKSTGTKKPIGKMGARQTRVLLKVLTERSCAEGLVQDVGRLATNHRRGVGNREG